MRKHLRKNDGFTLVELMVTLVVGSLITAAAVTILLLGLRVNRQSTETVSRQYTTRILLDALERLATEGEITQIVSEPDGWAVSGVPSGEEGDETAVFFCYVSEDQIVYAGGEIDADGVITGEAGTPLLEGVLSSYVEKDLESDLITFSVETSDGVYNSSIYCRLGTGTVSGSTDSGKETDAVEDTDASEKIDQVTKDDQEGTTGSTGAARLAFVKVLASQYSLPGGMKNSGVIVENGTSSDTYYSQWYCGGTYWEGWNASTPWCACYVSWALNQVSSYVNAPSDREGTDTTGTSFDRWYANVDDFMAYFVETDAWKNAKYYTDDGETGYTPLTGDLIFFDWKINSEANPEHVGVVLYVDGDYVYTIEGNTAGTVAVRKYALDDGRILGYGVLPWETTGATEN